MKTYTASLINALTLIFFSVWAYVASDTPSVTALIPAFFGVVITALYPLFRKSNKIAAHIVVLLTFLVLIGLTKPLSAAISANNGLALFRLSLMILTSVFSLAIYIRSFIEIRRQAANDK